MYMKKKILFVLAPCYCMKIKCKHFEFVKEIGGRGEKYQRYVCKAFPKGIPDEFVSGEKIHTEVIKGQKGNYTYEKFEGEYYELFT